MIKRCYKRERLFFVYTQILESMVDQKSPTLSEVSDISTLVMYINFFSLRF